MAADTDRGEAFGEGAPSRRYRTTLYMDVKLAAALKTLADRTHRTINGLIVEAVETLVASHGQQHRTCGTLPPTVDPHLGLRRDLERLSARLDLVEAGLRGATTPSDWHDPRPRLSPSDVRREVRALILARGAPIPHGELLAALEARYVLPGKRPTENLRTILTHTKARGFRLIRGQGYDLDPPEP